MMGRMAEASPRVKARIAGTWGVSLGLI